MNKKKLFESLDFSKCKSETDYIDIFVDNNLNYSFIEYDSNNTKLDSIDFLSVLCWLKDSNDEGIDVVFYKDNIYYIDDFLKIIDYIIEEKEEEIEQENKEEN